jgi:TATA-box binding protein (TBP) (component of TFIID and TFIIIB)
MDHFNETYRLLCQQSFDLKEKFEKLSIVMNHISLSTMTFIVALNTSLNIDKFIMFNNPTTKAKIKGCRIDVPKKETKFFNQISVRYEDFTKKSIKIFKNGKLQMTGITSYDEAIFVSNMIKDYINNTPEASDKEIKIEGMYIAMINTNFFISKHLHLEKLQTLIEETCKYATYEPDRYPGLNVKINNTSMLIFGTGNIIITGAKKLEDVQKTLEYIGNLLIENLERIGLDHAKKIQTKVKTSVRVKGYVSNEYLCYL